MSDNLKTEILSSDDKALVFKAVFIGSKEKIGSYFSDSIVEHGISFYKSLSPEKRKRIAFSHEFRELISEEGLEMIGKLVVSDEEVDDEGSPFYRGLRAKILQQSEKELSVMSAKELAFFIRDNIDNKAAISEALARILER